MGGVFINYRREVTSGEARALFEKLRDVLGADSVFMDVDSIALGRDYRTLLRGQLDSVEVMLVLIGRNWTQVKGTDGRRRLDDPNDFVRREIRTALERDIRVTPVLVQGASMPTEDELPEDIRDLAYRNSFELSHARWQSDAEELIRRLALTPTTAPELPAAPLETARDSAKRRKLTLALAAGVAVAMAAGGYFYVHLPQQQLGDAPREQPRLDGRSEASGGHAAAPIQPSGAEAGEKAGGELRAQAFKEIVATHRDGTVTRLRPDAHIGVQQAIFLTNGQLVEFDKLAAIEIQQPSDDGLVTLLLVDGKRLPARVVTGYRDLKGKNELGAYYASLDSLRRVEFVR